MPFVVVAPRAREVVRGPRKKPVFGDPATHLPPDAYG